jgi:transcriptional regulator with XRE-family HTH domain
MSMSNFGTQLRVIRALRGITQRQLASVTRIPNSYLSEIESGHLVPGPDWQERIMTALAWPADADTAFEILTK